MIKNILEILVIILILLLFGPIIIICACIGRFPVSMINENLIDIPLNGRMVRASVALVGVVVWILVVYLAVCFLFPNSTFPLAPSPPLPPECRFDNLLNCSDPVPIYVQYDQKEGGSQSTIHLTEGGLEVEFSNDKNGTGVCLKFSPALDVRGFSRLELSGASTRDFTFLVEYKVLVGGRPEPEIVTTSSQQSFHRTSQPQTIKIPLQYDGTINEIVINFPTIGESSLLTIDSIRLK